MCLCLCLFCMCVNRKKEVVGWNTWLAFASHLPLLAAVPPFVPTGSVERSTQSNAVPTLINRSSIPSNSISAIDGRVLNVPDLPWSIVHGGSSSATFSRRRRSDAPQPILRYIQIAKANTYRWTLGALGTLSVIRLYKRNRQKQKQTPTPQKPNRSCVHLAPFFTCH